MERARMQLAQMREMPERVAMMSLADRHGRVPLMERRELADGPGAAFRAFERKVSGWRSERSQLDEELVSMRASVAEISARTVDATEDAKLTAERACAALDALEAPKILEAAAEAKKAIGAAVEASKRDVLVRKSTQRFKGGGAVALSHHLISPTRWVFTQATSGGAGATR